MMEENTIKNELQKFQVTDAAIAKLNADYMVLAVKDANDSKGYEVVKAARIDVKKRRVEVEKTRVTLKADSLEYGRRVDGEAKRITALLEPIETHLIGQEKIVEDEKARLKAEAEAKEAARIQARVDRICSFGATFNGQMYTAYGLQIPNALVKVCTDEQFVQFIMQIQAAKDTEEARLKAEEDARKAEAERMAKVAADLEAIQQAQEEAATKMKAEQEALEAEKKRVADAEAAWLKAIEQEKLKAIQDKLRAEELEKAKKEAVAKALKDAEEKAKREAEAKAEAERLTKIAAEKKAARAPDKQKLTILADSLDTIMTPDVKTEEAKAFALTIMMELSRLIKTIRDKAEAM
jgi:hypothetical protein